MLDQVCKFAVVLLFFGSALVIPALLYPSAQQGVAETVLMLVGALVF